MLVQYMLWPHVLSVCPSVTSWSSTKTAKLRITQTRSHDSLGMQVCNAKHIVEVQLGSPKGITKCRWGRLELAVFLLCPYGMCVVIFDLSQVYHTEHPALFTACLPGYSAHCAVHVQ